MRFLSVVLIALLLSTLVGCGGSPTGPVQKTDPVPRQRFPQA